jgi:hypothetical protein
MLTRRQFIRSIAATLAVCGSSSRAISRAHAQSMAAGAEGLPEGALEAAILHALPGKRPLIKRTFRPPNWDTGGAQNHWGYCRHTASCIPS